MMAHRASARHAAEENDLARLRRERDELAVGQGRHEVLEGLESRGA